MRPFGTIRKFKTKQFTVHITAEEEPDLDLSWDDDGSTLQALESGECVAFGVRAVVYFQGYEIARDYLGGCIYESIAAFMDHKECGKQNRQNAAEGKSGTCGSYFSDMIAQVCRDARAELKKMQAVKIRSTYQKKGI